MEKRTIAAFALSAGFLFVYYIWILPFFWPPPPEGSGKEQAAPESPANESTAPTAEPVPDLPIPPEAPAREIMVETERFRMVWTTRGATLAGLTLKDYYRDASRTTPLEIFSPRDGIQPFELQLMFGEKDKRVVRPLNLNWQVAARLHSSPRLLPKATWQDWACLPWPACLSRAMALR
jgi:YidC/Oxa1 family membrane protein insertase